MIWELDFVSRHSAEELEEVYRTLTPSRKARIDRLSLPKDRTRSLGAELLARTLLKKIGERAEICCEENGRPYLSNSNLFISLAHSGDAVACVIDERPVGIDLEKHRPIRSALVQRTCSREEAELIFGKEAKEEMLSPHQQTRFLEVWTGKEAGFKAGEKPSVRQVDSLAIPRRVFHKGDYVITVAGK